LRILAWIARHPRWIFLAEFERDRVGYEDAAHRPSVPAARLAKAMLELIDSYRH
jgi:hypothetical protein